jgi:glyoxylase-like metal-dependent hydrolase (beta-lactamase superfamily II)
MAEALPFKTTMNFAYGEPRELAPGVVRIVANNPSPFTFKGTNTYLVGTGTLAVIDPGPDNPAHLDSILATAGGRPITHIVITHTHRDHTAAMPALLAKTAAKTAGFGRLAARHGDRRASPSGSEFVDRDFVPDLPLRDGQRLAGDGWALTALHTPGHALDHLCFALEGTRILFSGDHVMGWNTSVVAPPEGNMRAYMRSLELLMSRDDASYLPGHGGQVEDPRAGDPRLHPRRQYNRACHRPGDLQGPRSPAHQRGVSFGPRPCRASDRAWSRDVRLSAFF